MRARAAPVGPRGRVDAAGGNNPRPAEIVIPDQAGEGKDVAEEGVVVVAGGAMALQVEG